MRAARLVQLLLLLQARGRLTAAALAVELEVSEHAASCRRARRGRGRPPRSSPCAGCRATN